MAEDGQTENPPTETAGSVATEPPPSEATGSLSLDVSRPGGSAPDFSAILKAVSENNGQILEAQSQVEVARQQLAQARAAMFPRAYAQVIAAPLFEERGNAVAVTRNFNNWGPFISGELAVIQPLFTFGQLDGYKTAAQHQITANEGLVQMKRTDVLYSAKELYYSFQMAVEMEKLVKKLSKFLGEASEAGEQALKEGKKSPVREHDLYRLRSARQDLLQKKLFAEQARKTAEKAVLWMAANKYDDLTPEPLVPESLELKSIDEYLQMAKAFRAEYKTILAGQLAYENLAKAKQAQSYPTIFVGMFGYAAWSPVRDRQDSYYAMDPFNRPNGGVGVGLRMNFEFARHAAEAGEARAQAMKYKATESYAIPGIDLQVKRAVWEVQQAQEGLKIATERKDMTKKWFVSSAMGWSIGVTPAKDIMEALEGDGLSQRNYIETVFSLNMAIARLSQAVGKEMGSPNYPSN